MLLFKIIKRKTFNDNEEEEEKVYKNSLLFLSHLVTRKNKLTNLFYGVSICYLYVFVFTMEERIYRRKEKLLFAFMKM